MKYELLYQICNHRVTTTKQPIQSGYCPPCLENYYDDLHKKCFGHNKILPNFVSKNRLNLDENKKVEFAIGETYDYFYHEKSMLLGDILKIMDKQLVQQTIDYRRVLPNEWQFVHDYCSLHYAKYKNMFLTHESFLTAKHQLQLVKAKQKRLEEVREDIENGRWIGPVPSWGEVMYRLGKIEEKIEKLSAPKKPKTVERYNDFYEKYSDIAIALNIDAQEYVDHLIKHGE